MIFRSHCKKEVVKNAFISAGRANFLQLAKRASYSESEGVFIYRSAISFPSLLQKVAV